METTMIGYILPINCNSLLGWLLKYGYIGGSYIGVYKEYGEKWKMEWKLRDYRDLRGSI